MNESSILSLSLSNAYSRYWNKRLFFCIVSLDTQNTRMCTQTPRELIVTCYMMISVILTVKAKKTTKIKSIVYIQKRNVPFLLNIWCSLILIFTLRFLPAYAEDFEQTNIFSTYIFWSLCLFLEHSSVHCQATTGMQHHELAYPR